jgi:hypothetical protein
MDIDMVVAQSGSSSISGGGGHWWASCAAVAGRKENGTRRGSANQSERSDSHKISKASSSRL